MKFYVNDNFIKKMINTEIVAYFFNALSLTIFVDFDAFGIHEENSLTL